MAVSPMEADSRNGAFQRKQFTYKSLDESFEIQREMYRGQQYSQIYFARLHLMRTLLYSLLPTWKPHFPSCTVLGLEEGKECIIVGTLYNHMKLKPSILDEYSKENLGSKDQSKLSEPIKELDILLTQVAAGIPLDIMPGTNDPTNFSLPQQALHKCLFPGSTAYNTFRSCPNPHSFELDNVRFLGNIIRSEH